MHAPSTCTLKFQRAQIVLLKMRVASSMPALWPSPASHAAGQPLLRSACCMRQPAERSALKIVCLLTEPWLKPHPCCSLAALPTAGTADGLAAYMARQLSTAQREAEQEPLLRAPTSTAAAADSTADEAAAAAAATFAREAAAGGQPRRPPFVENAEGADRLLAGSAAGAGAAGGDQAGGRALPPAVLPTCLPEGHLPPVPAGPSLPLSEVLQSPATAPALPEAKATSPLPASPGELLRSRTGPLEEEGEEEASPAAARPSDAAAPPLPAQPRPSSAVQAGFTTGPSRLTLDSTAAAAAAAAGLVGPGGMPEGLAEPLESPLPVAQVLPLDSSSAGGASSSGLQKEAAPLPSNLAVSVAGNPFSPGTPALAAPPPAGPVLTRVGAGRWLGTPFVGLFVCESEHCSFT